MATIIERIKKRKILIVTIALFLVLFFGAFMRLWQLGYSSYWLDEGFTLMQARSIAAHGYPLLDSGYVEWKDLLMPYLIAPLIKIFSFEHPGVLRLWSAIFGISSILIGYHLAVRIFSYYTGLLFAFFIASCHWYIAWSQQARGYSAVIFFTLLFFYFLSKYEHNINAKWLSYAFLSIIFAVLAKKFSIILFVPFLFYFLGKKLYRAFLVFGVPSSLVVVYFIIKMWHILTINPLTYFGFYVKEYLFSYFGIFAILGLFGVVIAFGSSQKYKIFHASVVVFMISTIATFSLLVFVSERRYLIMITPFLFLYTAYFIEYISLKVGHKIMIGGLLFIFIVISSGVYDYSTILVPRKHYALEQYTPQPNYKKVYEKIIQDGFNEEDIIVSTNPLFDIIYLGRSDYAIPWSLTGREGDTTFIGDYEIYSGAKKLKGNDGTVGIGKIKKIQKESDVYVIMDSLASRRMEFDLWDDITDIGEEIFSDGEEHFIIVYKFSKIAQNEGAD